MILNIYRFLSRHITYSHITYSCSLLIIVIKMTFLNTNLQKCITVIINYRHFSVLCYPIQLIYSFSEFFLALFRYKLFNAAGIISVKNPLLLQGLFIFF